MFIIESHIKSEIETLLDVNCYPNYLPEDATKPAIVYNVVSGNSNKNISKIKDRRAVLQLTIISNSYSTSKLLQQQIYDFFEYYEHDDAKAYVQAEVNNIVDLYKLQLNQIAIDLSINYVVK